MPNTTITNLGLDYASSAFPVGTLIAPVYFVPVYDYRIDTLIHDNVISASPFSAITDHTETTPWGEIIWNNGADGSYTLSDPMDNFLISGTSNPTGSNPTVINNPVQSQKWQINLKNGVPLSTHYHGTSASFDSSNKTWDVYGYSISAGTNIQPSGKDGFFRIADYYPIVSASEGDSRVRGLVKCRLVTDIGTVKFNKIALYMVKYNNGVESSDPPVYFAEVKLKSTVIKTTGASNGFDDFTVDFQLDLHSVSADWGNVFFSTSGDYWARTPEGLTFPEKIGIGQFSDVTDVPKACLHINPSKSFPSEPLFRMERFADGILDSVQMDVNGNGQWDLAWESQTQDNSNGLYMGNGDTEDIATLAPADGYNFPLDLGTDSSRFNNVYINTLDSTSTITIGGEANISQNVNIGGTTVIQGAVSAMSTVYALSSISTPDEVHAGFLTTDGDGTIGGLAFVGGDMTVLGTGTVSGGMNTPWIDPSQYDETLAMISDTLIVYGGTQSGIALKTDSGSVLVNGTISATLDSYVAGDLDLGGSIDAGGTIFSDGSISTGDDLLVGVGDVLYTDNIKPRSGSKITVTVTNFNLIGGMSATGTLNLGTSAAGSNLNFSNGAGADNTSYIHDVMGADRRLTISSQGTLKLTGVSGTENIGDFSATGTIYGNVAGTVTTTNIIVPGYVSAGSYIYGSNIKKGYYGIVSASSPQTLILDGQYDTFYVSGAAPNIKQISVSGRSTGEKIYLIFDDYSGGEILDSYNTVNTGYAPVHISIYGIYYKAHYTDGTSLDTGGTATTRGTPISLIYIGSEIVDGPYWAMLS